MLFAARHRAPAKMTKVTAVLLVVLCAACIETAMATSADRRHHSRLQRVREAPANAGGSANPKGSATSTPGFSDCASLPNLGQCRSGGGMCVDSKVVECSGETFRKLCPGGNTVRCCRSQCKKVPSELPAVTVITRRTSDSPARARAIPSFNKLVDAYPQGIALN